MEATLNLKPKKRDVWYKEPWLLLVAGGPAFVVVASVITGYIAIKGSDKVVADDYYKQGLMINKDIQRDAKAKALGLNASLYIDLKTSKIRMQLNSAAPDTVLPEKVQLSLARASDNASSVNEVIHRLPLNRNADGSYEGDLNFISKLSSGSVKLFHIKLETTDWRLTGDWYNPEVKVAQLSAF